VGNQDALDKLVAQKAEGGLTQQEKAEISEQAKKLKDVNLNLAYARHAVAFVLQKVRQVANWDEPLEWSAEDIYRRTGSRAQSEAAWNAADRCVYGNLRQKAEWQRLNAQPGGVQDVDDIRILSGLADSFGCGNCGEMTARTFMFLYELGIRPLDFMVLINPADHAFVVIGRKASPDNDNVGRNWGKCAVVCDPWAHGRSKPLKPGTLGPPDAYGPSHTAYPATLLEQNMRAMHSSFSGVMVAVSV
jgi:hypothetical protein